VSWLSDSVVEHLRTIADAPDLSGTKYDLGEKIGEGGMASVYRAHDRELDRPVAIKVLSDSLVDDRSKQRMVAEARIIGRLEHPAIVPIHDSGLLPDGRVFYVMKLVRGRRLDEYAKSVSELKDRLRIFGKICEAVAFAHANGVIHRDLKPQNVMVGAFGEVLVMDWGLAKKLRESGESTQSPTPQKKLASGIDVRPENTDAGVVMGTPGYMAPEQARGEVERLDERTDIFGLGGILYFLLTSEKPVRASPTTSKTQPTNWTTVTSPRTINPSIPRPLAAICLKALAESAEERYDGAPSLAADIEAFIAGERVTAYPEGLFGTALRLFTKYRTAVLLIVAYLIMRILLLISGFQ
jgi:serine/threonine protein kinase